MNDFTKEELKIKFKELFPDAMNVINSCFVDMMILGTGAIEATPDGIKTIRLKDKGIK